MQSLKPQPFQARQLLQATIDECPVASTWAPDGSCLAIGSASGRIHLFDTRGDRCLLLYDWQAHTAPLQELAWHPFEPLLSSSAQDGSIRHWLVGEDHQVTAMGSIEAATTWVERFQWRPDGRYLAVAAGKLVRIHDRTGKLVNEAGFDTTVAALAWHPRGTELAVGGHQYLTLLTGAAATLRKQGLSTQGSLISCHWSPNGKILAAPCQDCSVHFWRINEVREASMSGYGSKPRALDWTADSRFLVVGGNPSMTVWRFGRNSPEGTAPEHLNFHKQAVTALAINRLTGQLAAGCRGSVVSLWHAVDAKTPYYHFAMEGPVERLLWQTKGSARRLAALDRSGHIGIWEIGS